MAIPEIVFDHDCSLDRANVNGTQWKVAHIIHNACIRTTESIFSSGIPEDGDRISFEEFADWYTNEGYNIIPWIEFRFKKGHITIVSVDDDRLSMGSTDDGTDANDSTNRWRSP